MTARHSLARRLALRVGGALVAGVVLLLGLWTVLAPYEFGRTAQRENLETASHVAASLQFDDADRPVAVHLSGQVLLITGAAPKDFLFQVVDEDGDVLLASNGDYGRLLPLPPAQAVGLTRLTVPYSGRTLRLIVQPVHRPLRTSYIVAARSNYFDEGRLSNDLRNSQATALIAAVLAMGIVLAVILFTLRRLFKPVTDLSAMAAEIDPLNLRVRLPADDVPTEIAPLITAFNAALERLERGFRNQQEFLANVAHELKTPLTVIRGRLEQDGPLDRAKVLRDLDHVARHVQQLLHLAEVSDPYAFRSGQTPVLRIAERVADLLGFLASRRDVALAVDIAADLAITADDGALLVLLRNLVENAILHSPPGGVVSIAASPAGLRVGDEGPGVAEADRPHLFDRFWRGAHRRHDGAGLGLSICQEVATAHGWTLSVRPREPRGAEFVVDWSGAPSGVC